MIGELPTTLTVNGTEHPIRTDYRDILTVLVAFNDPELEDNEKVYICLYGIYEDFEDLAGEDYEAAYAAAVSFIDAGAEPKKEGRSPKTMDWEQDERLLFPAINRAAGCEVRALPYLHWWTFIGYFMEIRDGVFSQVLALRHKKAKGKKLEKWEREFWSQNRDICQLRTKLSKAEQEQKDRLNKLLG